MMERGLLESLIPGLDAGKVTSASQDGLVLTEVYRDLDAEGKLLSDSPNAPKIRASILIAGLAPT